MFQQEEDVSGPGKELTDIAAEAQSLQPKGYTLETATVSSLRCCEARTHLLKNKCVEFILA